MPRNPRLPQTPPVELDADMRPDDLVNELRQLKFHDAGEFKTLWVDSGVRDFLIDRLGGRRRD